MFTKGDPRCGRPKTTPEAKALKRLTKAEMEEALHKYILLPINELQAVIEDRTLPVLDHWICRILLVGIKEGDDRRLTFMFDRLVGKVKDTVDHNVSIGVALKNQPDHVIIELAKESIKKLSEG